MTQAQTGDRPPLDGPAALLAPALLDWASRDDPACPRVCLVTGGRGTGKSRLLAWLLTDSTRQPVPTVHAAAPARGHTAQTLSWELGRQLGYGPLDPGALLERLRTDDRPLRLVVADLHLAGRGPADLPSAAPAAVVTELLQPLLALPGVRAAVEVDRAELLPVADPLVLALPTGGDAPADPAAASGADAPGPGGDWRWASAAARETALDQAVRDGTAPGLLADPGYLALGSAVAVTAALADRRIAVPPRLRTVWAAAGPALGEGGMSDSERAAVLHAAALTADPRLARYLRPLAEQHLWTAAWSRPGLRTAGLALTGNGLLVADPAGRLHAHDPADGSLVARLATDPRQRPARIASAGAGQLLTVDAVGHLQLLRTPPAGPGGAAAAPAAAGLRPFVQQHNAAVLAGTAAAVTAVAADSGSVAVADARGWFHLLHAAAPPATVRGHSPYQAPITAIACLVLPDARDGLCLVVTGRADGSVRLWNSATRRSMPDPVEQRGALPTALAAARTAAGPVLAVAWSDRRLHLWRLAEGRFAAIPLLQDVDALALTPEGLLLCGGPQGTLALSTDPAAL
ncbi:hypothetical protein GXW83_21895 [Streptacidiphilus sp. PB12-B1b]|uniref:hypothetical protein n=1 Tax=Streptacidiphilus sp. PB12-B1b TaxID=2705012 RepID=UPI0015FAC579|nr:hypothetical protein [Streptacidiphilus sp. PB12-B1b]QMU77953.1 hypothetical protein GXW83_21895 [Streptacidiphilus sp. PB12-B1b]